MGSEWIYPRFAPPVPTPSRAGFQLPDHAEMRVSERRAVFQPITQPPAKTHLPRWRFRPIRKYGALDMRRFSPIQCDSSASFNPWKIRLGIIVR